MQVLSLSQEDHLEEETATPLQYSCLGNPLDRGAWRATAHGVTETGTTKQRSRQPSTTTGGRLAQFPWNPAWAVTSVPSATSQAPALMTQGRHSLPNQHWAFCDIKKTSPQIEPPLHNAGIDCITLGQVFRNTLCRKQKKPAWSLSASFCYLDFSLCFCRIFPE